MSSKEELSEQLFEVALELVQMGQSNVAEQSYQMALELNPRDYRSLTNMATIIDKSGRLEEAEDLYKKASGLPFYDAFAMFNLGYLYSRTGKPELAETWYRRSLVSDPTHSPAMVNLAGLVQSQRGDIDEAKSLLEAALGIQPKDTIAMGELANIYRQKGAMFEAEMLYFKAMENEPENPWAIYNYGAFLEEIGEPDKARYFFDLAYNFDVNGTLKRGGK